MPRTPRFERRQNQTGWTEEGRVYMSENAFRALRKPYPTRERNDVKFETKIHRPGTHAYSLAELAMQNPAKTTAFRKRDDGTIVETVFHFKERRKK